MRSTGCFRFLLLTLFMAVILPAHAATNDSDITGYWQTIDDETGKAKSIVQLYMENGKLYGKVVDLLLKPDDTLCKECKGDLHQKPVVGMVILSDMERDGDQYKGGQILDPANGKFYRCKLWLENKKLQVRGYLGPFFRTQQWQRVAAPEPAGTSPAN